MVNILLTSPLLPFYCLTKIYFLFLQMSQSEQRALFSSAGKQPLLRPEFRNRKIIYLTVIMCCDLFTYVLNKS